MLFNRVKQVFTIPTRNFKPNVQPQDDGSYRGLRLRRYGYEAHHHTKGLLPRLKTPERRLNCLPITTKESPWSPRQARMGENDLIRLLGDDRIKQHELLTHIPEWLRGYRTSSEYSVLQIKRREFDYWRYTKPLKWKYLQERIRFLYRRLNNKYKPPDVERLSSNRYIS